MDKRIYDIDGICNLLAAVFHQAHREARQGREDAINFLDCLAPDRRKSPTVDSKQNETSEVMNGS